MRKEFRIKFLNKVYILGTGEVLIGRDKNCQIRLEGDLVSRHHARLKVDHRNAIFEDLQSANGSYVNDKRALSPIELKDGDRIKIAFFELEFEDSIVKSETAPTVKLLYCTECGAALTSRMNYCVQCGKRISDAAKKTVCPRCQHMIAAGMKYCMMCGLKLTPENFR